MIEVQLPDGRTIEFPAGTSPEIMQRVAAQAVQQPALPTAAAAPGDGQPSPGRGGGFLPFVNRAIAGVAGAPVDIANAVIGMDPRYLPFGVGQAAAAAGARPLPVSQQPLGGSASIEAGLARLGSAVNAPMVPEVGQQPVEIEEYLGRGVGEAAGMLIPGYGAARAAAQSAGPVVSRVGQSLTNAMTRAPSRFAAAEMAAGAGAGAGRYVAEENFPGDPTAALYGELAGGLGVGALLSAPGLAWRYSPTTRMASAAITPFTKSGAQSRAANRMMSLAEDPFTAARLAETPTISDLTPAQRTGEPRLLALEKAAADENPALAKQLRDRAAAAQETLEAEARALGGRPEDTRAFLESRVTRLTDALNIRVEQAQARARERIAALEPDAPAADASRIAREEFDKAYEAARRQESDLWRSIPGDVRIDTAPLFQRFQALVDATPSTGREDIPAYARRFLGREAAGEGEDEATALIRQLQPDLLPPRPQSARLGAAATPAELQTLRSKLLEIERTAYKEGRRNEGRIAGQIADDVLDTLDSVPETSGAYDVARSYSRNMNELFRGGQVRPLSRMGDAAEANIPPELTLERLIGSGGARGDIAARDLLAATGDSPETRAAIENYLAQSFRNKAVSAEGRLKPESVTNWMRTNAALLDRFPDVRNRLAEAVSAQGRMETLTARQAAVERGLRQRGDTRMERLLDQRQESATARYLNAEPGAEVGRVFKADDPAALAASLRRSVDRDPSGKALSGLRGAFIDNLFARARQTTPDGPVFNGSVIMDALADPKQAAALGKIFDPPALRRLQQIGTELTALERTRGDLPNVGRVMEDTPSKVLDIVGRVFAARTAAAFSGGTGIAGGLQSAQIASSNMRAFLTKLTRDRAQKLLTAAVTDPDLFATLMSPMRTAAQQNIAARRLQGWMAGTAGRAVTGEESGEQPPPNAMAPRGAPPANAMMPR